jgi:hypothetical protein
MTRAAIRLRNAMTSMPWQRALRVLPEPASEIVDQLFVIAIRRRFGREPPSIPLEDFASRALEPDAIDDGETLLRYVLGWQGANGNSDKRYLANLIVALLSQLRTDGAIPDSEMDRLVVTAEARAVRMLRHKAASAGRASKWFSPSLIAGVRLIREYRSSVGLEVTDPVPSSIVGQKLKAIARFDFETRDRMPPDGNVAGVVEVVNAAFSRIVRHRFNSLARPQEVARVATRVGETAKGKLDPASIVNCISQEWADVQGSREATYDSLYIKMMTVAQIVEDLGIYDTELDSLLLDAEQLAVSRGYPPTPMPRRSELNAHR